MPAFVFYFHYKNSHWTQKTFTEVVRIIHAFTSLLIDFSVDLTYRVDAGVDVILAVLVVMEFRN